MQSFGTTVCHFLLIYVLGGHRRGVTPVPIPNTVVKPSTADGTCLKRGWESMKLPGFILKKADLTKGRPFFFLEWFGVLSVLTRPNPV